jgi:alkanesulfonate monooxygenase SsuD/methylene tetrahydromethanopterin reductase-like flavin-dependent oxidoreductase (luciferase family)
MRIGLYQDLRDPPRWRRGRREVYAAALERVEEAERVGLDSVWCTEHHFFEDGYLPQPLTWCAAVAARTSRIALGTAILLAPLHQPLEIAEQAAVVDQVSGGRLELGLGAGYAPREFEAFGVDIRRRFATTERNVVEVKRLLDEGVVTPGPAQERLPIWFGGFGPRGARFAGREGLGLLLLDGRMLETYREGIVEGGHDPDLAVLGGLATMVLSRDPERAWARLAPHLAHQRGTYVEAAESGGDGSGAGMMTRSAGDKDPDAFRSEGPHMVSPRFDAVTPEEAVRRLREWLGGLPVSDVFFWESVAGMPEDMVAEHLALLAEIRPLLAGLSGTDADVRRLRR